MKKIYLVVFACLGLTPALLAQTNCSNGRYGQEIFTNVTVTSDIVYGNNLPLSNIAADLMLDVYEPQGDTDNNRPLVIVAHGGSFVGGSKTGPDVVPICEDLAKRGFVVASISYRLGIENLLLGPDSTDGAEAVIRASHDGKAAVRFFRKDVAENNNTYRIDEDNIYFGGVSAGGFIALNVGYFDKDSEIPSYVDTSKPNVDATAEGSSGNSGYSSEVNAVVNIAGAMADTSWIEAGDVPLLSMHGDMDNTVPYDTDLITVLGNPMLAVDGSQSIHQRAENLGLEHCFKTQIGEDHVPHVTDAAHYDTLRTYVGNFLYWNVCGFGDAFCNDVQVVSTQELAAVSQAVSVYPNPATTMVTLYSGLTPGTNYSVRITDLTGRLVRQEADQKTTTMQLDRNDLPAGVYLLHMDYAGGTVTSKVIFQ